MRAELNALKALLDQGPLAGRVFLGDAPDDAAVPYVVIEGQRNMDEHPRFADIARREVLQPPVVSVGSTFEQAAWADDQVDARLRPNRRGVKLTVPGRSCTPMERRSTYVAPDDSAGRVIEITTSYRFTSTPK